MKILKYEGKALLPEDTDEQLQIGGYDSISNTFRTVRTSVKEYEAKWGDK